MITILSSRGVFLDGEFAGTVTSFLLKHPDLAAELQAALDVREDTFRANLAAARSAAGLQPPVSGLPPLPEYYQVIELAKPLGDATHAGILRPPAIGGTWEVDLLRAVADTVDTYTLVKPGVQIPAGKTLTSFTELRAEFAAADLAASLDQAAEAKASEANP